MKRQEVQTVDNQFRTYDQTIARLRESNIQQADGSNNAYQRKTRINDMNREDVRHRNKTL